MTASLRLHLAAAGAVFRRDLALFVSYRTRFVTTLFSIVVSITLFYYVSRLVRSPEVGDADDYYAFVVVGLVSLAVMTSTLALPIATLRAELIAGTFERMVLSPFGAVRGIISLLLFPVAMSVLTGTLSLTYAAVVFGLELQFPEALLALPAVLLGALAFAPFGIAMTAAVVLFKQTNAGAAFIVTAITLLAGVYFPVSLLPDWIEWASAVQPFTPAIDLMRYLLVGTPVTEGTPAGAALKLAAFAIVALPLGVLALSSAVRRSRRRGTIIEA